MTPEQAIDATPDRKADQRRGRAILKAIADRLAEAGHDVEDIGRLTRIGAWQQAAKVRQSDGSDEIVVTDLHGFQLAPAWDTDPEWPPVQPAPPVKVFAKGRPKRIDRDHTVTVVLPDQQIGYWRLDDGTLVEIHDEAAMDVAIQIVRHLAPDRCVNLGDVMDQSEWSSKFAVHPEFVLTTQAAIDRTSAHLAEQRANMPADLDDPHPVKMLLGNHDDRLAKAITKNAMAALRLRRANAPESWPVLSLEHLLDVDAIGVEISDGYPAGRFKLADGCGSLSPLFVRHGTETNDTRRTAQRERQSFIEGHSHRVQQHWSTYELDGAPVDVMACKLGCLARRDGAVPSFKGATRVRGGPAPVVEDWQHAVGVVRVWPDGRWTLEPVMIRDGRAFYDGREFVAERHSTPIGA